MYLLLSKLEPNQAVDIVVVVFCPRLLCIGYNILNNISRIGFEFFFCFLFYTVLRLLLRTHRVAHSASRSYVVHGVHLVLGAVVVVPELDVVVQIVVDERNCVVDAHRLGELAVRLEISRLVGRVL